MKKLLFPLAIIAISFASCSDDDSMPTPVDPTPVDPTPTPAVELKLFTSSNTSGAISYTDLLATTPTQKVSQFLQQILMEFFTIRLKIK